jgi:hypothetical protein
MFSTCTTIVSCISRGGYISTQTTVAFTSCFFYTPTALSESFSNSGTFELVGQSIYQKVKCFTTLFPMEQRRHEYLV